MLIWQRRICICINDFTSFLVDCKFMLVAKSVGVLLAGAKECLAHVVNTFTFFFWIALTSSSIKRGVNDLTGGRLLSTDQPTGDQEHLVALLNSSLAGAFV